MMKIRYYVLIDNEPLEKAMKFKGHYSLQEAKDKIVDYKKTDNESLKYKVNNESLKYKVIKVTTKQMRLK